MAIQCDCEIRVNYQVFGNTGEMRMDGWAEERRSEVAEGGATPRQHLTSLEN